MIFLALQPLQLYLISLHEHYFGSKSQESLGLNGFFSNWPNYSVYIVKHIYSHFQVGYSSPNIFRHKYNFLPIPTLNNFIPFGMHVVCHSPGYRITNGGLHKAMQSF